MTKVDKETKKVQKKFEADYEQLGKLLQNVVESGYIDKHKIYKMSFVKGVIAGFGGVIGATIVVALLVWILSLFSDVPLLNKLTESIRDTVQQEAR